jgi:hypothetical protein
MMAEQWLNRVGWPSMLEFGSTRHIGQELSS